MTAAPWPGVVETASTEEKEYALDRAINALREDHPLQSASTAIFGWQKPVLIGLLLTTAGFAAWQPMKTAIALIGLCTVGYVLTMADRVLIFREGLASRPITISDETARAIRDDDLPRYTILVPAYNEPEVVGDLIGAMTALDYPRRQAAGAVAAGGGRRRHDRRRPHRAVDPTSSPSCWCRRRSRGPSRRPATTACTSRPGEIVTIYDAEDLPEPLQLRRVAAAFRRAA